MQLSDMDKISAAQACRVAAVQADNDAKVQPNPSTKATFERVAKNFRDLADRFQAACSPK